MSVKRLTIPVDTCVECGSKENIVMHHIMPQSRGGKFMVPVCQPCHDKIHGCRVRNISISQLCKDGIEKARARGVKIGGPRPDISISAMVEGNKKAMEKFARESKPFIAEARNKGMTTLQDIANYLNTNDILSRTGRNWYPNSVRRAMQIQGTYKEYKEELKTLRINKIKIKALKNNKKILEQVLTVMKEFNITKLQDISDKLNERKVYTVTGREFRPSTVKYLLNLLQPNRKYETTIRIS
jgi:hypothetical protein